MKDLTKGNPIKLILTFALPVLMGNILQLCYSFADVYIVGSNLGDLSLAAVGSTTAINSLIIGFLLGTTNGFSVLTARFFGAKDEKNLKKAIASTITLGLCLSTILTLFSIIFLDSILQCLNTPADIYNEARTYICIILAGMTLTMIYNICASTLRAIGDSITPLVFLFISSILNIGLDIIFIKFLKTGVAGAAYATLISQIICIFLCLLYIYHKYPMLRLEKEDFEPDIAFAKTMLTSGLSMGTMMSLVYFGTLALQSSINTFGPEIIVAHTAARKLTELYMLPFSAFGTTMATYCGQNLGAGKYRRIREGLIKIILITWCWCLLVILASYTIAPLLVKLVTGSKSTVIIKTATKYLRVNSLFYFVPAIITLVRNSMQGIGDYTTPIISSFIELVGKVFIVIFLTPKIEYDGIIISEPIVWILMVIPLIVMIIRNPAIRNQENDTIDNS